MDIINNLAGYNVAKTIDEIIFKAKNISYKNCLILSTNKNGINKFQNLDAAISKMTLDQLINAILKKAPAQNFKHISDFTAIQILASISKREMSEHFALKNLCKSTMFSRELYNLFGLFKSANVKLEELLEISNDESLSPEDKNRFKIILNIFEKYNIFLNNNNFLDYKDSVLKAIEILNNNKITNDLFKEKYKFIFVYGAENLSKIQLDLLNLLTNKLILFVDNNAAINGFKGIADIKNSSPLKPDTEILSRALFLINGGIFTSTKTDKIKYCQFEDFLDEMDYIAKDIINELEKGTQPSELAILTRDNSIKQKLVDVLNLYSIPVNSELYSEDYQKFKLKFNRLLNMFEIFEKLQLHEFNFKNFFNLNTASKVDLEILAEQLNLYTQNIFTEIFKNKYAIENLNILKEKSKETFLIATAYKNIDLLTEDDKSALIKKVSEINKLYTAYQNNNLIDIVVKIANIFSSADENYNKFIAKFITRLKELCNLKYNILNEKIDIKTISELLELTLEESDTSQEKITLQTCFKSIDCEFKKVYIPALTDGYFPKKSKWTQFISSNANNIISKKINSIHKNFGKIINSSEEELLDEQHLFYVALSTAKKQIVLSTHKYENTKLVQPSSFFEQLSFIDVENNFEPDNSLTETEEINKVTNNKNYETDPEVENVIKKEDLLYLSASSMTTFLKCPKMFYLKHLLSLKEKDSFSTSYGTLVHAIFENLLKNHLSEFSKEKVLELGKNLFNSKKNPQKAIDDMFEKEIIDRIQELSDLNILEMQTYFIGAITSLEKNGFFAQIPTEANCEIAFKFSLEEIENVTFSGFIDLIAKYENGYRITDYKTGRNKKKLAQLICDTGVNFLSKAGTKLEAFSETKVKEFEYQVPLYYFACLNAEELKNFKEQIYDMGYQYIRPENKEQGSTSDFITASEIQNFKNKIIENIKTYIVEKIRNKTYFEAKYDKYNCKYCQFGSICDLKTDDEVKND